MTEIFPETSCSAMNEKHLSAANVLTNPSTENVAGSTIFFVKRPEIRTTRAQTIAKTNRTNAAVRKPFTSAGMTEASKPEKASFAFSPKKSS